MKCNKTFVASRCPQSMAVACLNPCDLRDGWVKHSCKAIEPSRQSSAWEGSEHGAQSSSALHSPGSRNPGCPTIAFCQQWLCLFIRHLHGILGWLKNTTWQHIPREFTDNSEVWPRMATNQSMNKGTDTRAIEPTLEFSSSFCLYQCRRSLFPQPHTSWWHFSYAPFRRKSEYGFHWWRHRIKEMLNFETRLSFSSQLFQPLISVRWKEKILTDNLHWQALDCRSHHCFLMRVH